MLLPSLRPALPLIDLHDIPRRDFHQSLIDVLKDQLRTCLDNVCKEQIQSPSKSKDPSAKVKSEIDMENNPVILSLVEKNFVLIEFEPLQDILFDALSRLPQIPEEILTKIETNKAVYRHSLCKLSVKRQIWQKNQNLFGEEISPLLSEYIKTKESVMYSTSDQSTFMSSVPKMRRQGSVVKRLIVNSSSEIFVSLTKN